MRLFFSLRANFYYFLFLFFSGYRRNDIVQSNRNEPERTKAVLALLSCFVKKRMLSLLWLNLINFTAPYEINLVINTIGGTARLLCIYIHGEKSD